MSVSRIGMSGLRQATAAARKPNALFSQNLPRLALAARLPMNLQTRPMTSTSKLTESDAQALLASQRRQRPVSPHLTIYDPSGTWLTASIWTRITGSWFSIGLYSFSLAYLASPLLGWHLESATLASAFGALPVAMKGGLKLMVATPFAFHCINGVRHFFQDVGFGYAKKQITKINVGVWSLSFLTAFALAFLM